MSDLLLYQFETSPYCTKVRAVLDYKGLPYTLKNVSPLTKKAIKFSKIGKVPILSHGDFIVEDSTPIVLYLEENFPNPALLPAEGPEREEILAWEDWADERMPTVYQYIAYTRPRNAHTQMRKEALAMEGDTWEKFAIGTVGEIAFPLMLKSKMKISSLLDLKEEVHRSIDRIESTLEKHAFLCGKHQTLADVVVWGFANDFRGLRGDDIFFGCPAIAAWDEKMAALVKHHGRLPVKRSAKHG